MKKILITYGLMISMLLPAMAQQSPGFTQYMLNQEMINPALTGMDNYLEVKSGHRFQWIGMTDPPVTNILSISAPHPSLPMGYGGSIFHDVTGPTSRTEVSGSYAYAIRVKGDIHLSFGLNLGILQYKLDGTQLTIKNTDDPSLQPIVYNSCIPNAGAGIYARGTNWYAGLSANQLLNNKLRFYEDKSGLNKLKSHIYLTAGYRTEINNHLQAEPSVLLKTTSPGIWQIDFSTLLYYRDNLWAGLSYRYKEAISFMIGHRTSDKLFFAYAYDAGLGEIRHYNSGTHELILGYRIRNIRE